MVILGISAFVHDSAACLIRNGQIVANAEEERFNRVKHTAAFPINSVRYVLQQGEVGLDEVDLVAFNWNPYRSLCAEVLKLLLLPATYLKVYRYSKPPKNFRSITATLLLRRTIEQELSGRFKGRIMWVDHHHAHAAAAYGISPFNREDADVVVVDAHGDDCSASVYTVVNRRFTLQWKVPVFDSLGIVYSNFTRFLGFDSYQEGKTMALASYGEDRFKEAFEKIVRLKPEGRYEIVQKKKYLALWNYLEGGLDEEFGRRRERDEPLEQRHYDLARSMQNRIKEAILHMVRHTAGMTRHRNLGLAGGVFLNCDINRDIVRSGLYDNVFVPPVASDSGGAVGAALYAAAVHDKEEHPRRFSPYLGPEYDDAEILRAVEAADVSCRKVEAPWRDAAQALKDHRVIGWFQGRMECGPRALGNRSILANPMSSEIRDHLNRHVKKRETFRPFAPVATREAALRCFDLQEPLPELTRYMLVTTRVRPEYRELLPGITHVDGTARIQVVEPETNPLIHRLLVEFERLTGVAVLINTSFNRHEPIVCSPADALRCYREAGLDALYIGNYAVGI